MACLVCFASCSNGSSDSGGSQGSPYDINYSLGNPPDENKRTDKFEIVNNSEGIYLEFDYPKSEDYWRTIVYVEGLGTIAEEVQDFDTTKTKGCFFYPFVDAGKEYTIRFVSFANEKKDENGFVINGDTVLSWFETKVTAGAKSKGEVRFTSKGRISVDKKGNFRFTERPTFQNENLLGNNWVVEIGLVEGISWAHGDERKTDWHGSVQIPQADLLKQINFFEKCPWLPGIDFICVRPVLENYEHNGKKYRYQWDGFVEDIFYPPKIQTIDINNPQDVAKIIGTWTQKDEWDETEHFLAKVHGVYNETLIINDTTVQSSYSSKYTKLDGSAFTKEEIADGWGHYYLSNILDTLPNNYFYHEVGEFYDDHDPTHFIYSYKIYMLYDDVVLSSDYKTLTEKYDKETTLSEYLEKYNYEEDQESHHCELKLSQDGRELQMFHYGTDEDGYYEYTEIYNKQ